MIVKINDCKFAYMNNPYENLYKNLCCDIIMY